MPPVRGYLPHRLRKLVARAKFSIIQMDTVQIANSIITIKQNEVMGFQVFHGRVDRGILRRRKKKKGRNILYIRPQPGKVDGETIIVCKSILFR